MKSVNCSSAAGKKYLAQYPGSTAVERREIYFLFLIKEK